MFNFAQPTFWLLFLCSTAQIYSGVIILIDRTTYYGQLQSTGEKEYTITATEGTKTTVATKDIMRVINDDAQSVWYNRPKLPRKWKKETGGFPSRSWFGAEVSENGLPGLGFTFEYYLGNGFAPTLAVGAAPWGPRYGTSLRYYFDYAKTALGIIPAVALGYSHTDGTLDSVQVVGNDVTTTISVDSVNMVHISGLVFIEEFKRAVRFYGQLGYALPIGGKPGYRVLANNDRQNRSQIEQWRPGGPSFSLGAALAF